MSDSKAPKAPRGFRSVTVTLPINAHVDFRLLAIRLELPPEEAARRLLIAAVEAFQDQQEFVWPLGLAPLQMPASEQPPAAITAASIRN